MEILIPVLMGVAAVVLIVFMVVFDKIAQNKRSIEYESGRAKYWHDKWDVLDGKVSKLFTNDQHNFERPRIDLLTELMSRQAEQKDRRLSELYQKFYDLKNDSKKEVK